MDPLIMKYLGDKYSDEERSKVEEKAREEKNKLALIQAASGFGEALAGRAPTGSAQYFGGLRSDVDKNTIGKFDQGRKQALMDYELGQKLKEDERVNEINSPEMQSYKVLGARLGMPKEQMDKMSIKQFREVSPMFQKVYEIEQDKLRRQEDRAFRERSFQEDRRRFEETLEEKKKLNNSDKRKFENMPEDTKVTITDMAKKNVSKLGIANQIDSVMSAWDSYSDDQKLAQGRMLLKTLNSPEGADAIGAEEANRLGSKLEFAMGNFANSNPTQFGRDLKGFKEQAQNAAKNLKNTIKANQKIINEAYGRDENYSPYKISDGKQIVKKEVNDETGQVRVTYSDGSTEIKGGK